MLDSGLLSHDDIDRLRPRVYEAIAAETSEQCWIKVHDAYTSTPGGEPLLGRNVARAAVYLVRDPRDVAISLAHHNHTAIDDMIKEMNAADSALCHGSKGLAPQLRQKLNGWSGHVTSWLDQTDVPVHTVRYEDLTAAPTKCWRCIGNLLAAPRRKRKLNARSATRISPSCSVRRARKASRKTVRAMYRSSAVVAPEAGGRR